MIPVDAFMQVLGKDYIALRQNLKAYCFNNNLSFNEDVFHNTLLNCYNTVNNNGITFETEEEVKYYFCKAFKLNLLRNKGYSDNKPKEELSKYEKSCKDNQIELCDFETINKMISSKFGEYLYNIFIEHIEGTSIADLQEKYKNIKNLKQRIKDIKIFVNITYYNYED